MKISAIIAKAGQEFTRRKGFKEGDLVFVEHYVMCGKCEWCHKGEYRLCEATDWRSNPEGIRYGYTPTDRAPHLWGGFAQYAYLPWNAVMHHVPKGVSPELAGLVTPMANGVEWSLFDGGVGYNSRVLIQGPGQQGLSQTVICKQAGASLIIVTGTSKDAARLEVAKQLGADYVIDVDKEDPLARIKEITGGEGRGYGAGLHGGCRHHSRFCWASKPSSEKADLMVVQGEMAEFPNYPIGKIAVKYITMKARVGTPIAPANWRCSSLHRRFRLDLVTTHRFGLKDVDLAIKSVGNQEGGLKGVIHASLMPWE